jgi:TadE-like protein
MTGRRYGPDRGSATAELAVCLPALVLLLMVGLTAVVAVRTQLECLDAAREAVLAAARGDSGVAAGIRVAPTGATVSVAGRGETVTATVRASVHPLGGWAPGIDVAATAVAAVEPGVTP